MNSTDEELIKSRIDRWKGVESTEVLSIGSALISSLSSITFSFYFPE